MTFVIMRHRVRDFETWLQLFRDHAPTRREYGCRKATVRRSVDSPNDVLITFDWSTPDAFHDFVENSDLEDVMKKAGVIGEPFLAVYGDPVHRTEITV